jgi:hypothetical protein
MGGEVDHHRATDGPHCVQNQPTSVNDDERWKSYEIRVFDGNQQQSITLGWHSQGGSAGSNPVGATLKQGPGQVTWALLLPPHRRDLVFAVAAVFEAVDVSRASVLMSRVARCLTRVGTSRARRPQVQSCQHSDVVVQIVRRRSYTPVAP